VRLVCISDTHGRHHDMPQIPAGDILIHAGDCTSNGSLPAIDDFTCWFGSLPHRNKVLIAGNHDFCFERYPEWSREFCEKNGIIYLQDEQAFIGGVLFYGSPWTPVFRQMAFNATEEEMREIRAQIPDSTNVLVTHGPAYRTFDFVPRDEVHVGCFLLAQRIGELEKLQVHICGHVHESYGFAIRDGDGLKCANAATCNGSYRPVNTPIIIDI